MTLRSNLKLSPRYYGPFQVLQKIGEVAYRLQLPDGAKIHPIFHVSCLKRKLGVKVQTQSALPKVDIDGIIQPEPKIILDRRLVKKGHRAVPEVLVKWQGLEADDATWESYHQLQERFPDLNLEDKVCAKGEGMLCTHNPGKGHVLFLLQLC